MAERDSVDMQAGKDPKDIAVAVYDSSEEICPKKLSKLEARSRSSLYCYLYGYVFCAVAWETLVLVTSVLLLVWVRILCCGMGTPSAGHLCTATCMGTYFVLWDGKP
ncbi:hypothetical protein BaRGS_00026489 [Batillaria attramentaria]|uniref:Uncharacterized protein n=1 Tax=Batillaria attramentaria TaxID=370345 RepID=A0ABD0K5N9_9CAEN